MVAVESAAMSTEWFLAVSESEWTNTMASLKSVGSAEKPFPVGIWYRTAEFAIEACLMLLCNNSLLLFVFVWSMDALGNLMLEALCSESARRLRFSPSGHSASLEANVKPTSYTKLQLQGVFYCVILTPKDKFSEFIQSGGVTLEQGRLRFHVPPVLAKDATKFLPKARALLPLL